MSKYAHVKDHQQIAKLLDAEIILVSGSFSSIDNLDLNVTRR